VPVIDLQYNLADYRKKRYVLSLGNGIIRNGFKENEILTPNRFYEKRAPETEE
jgi:hypothetical protein